MKEIKATAPTPQDWIELVRENERLKEIIMSNKTKTVADAVEVFDSKWPEYMAQGGCADVIVYIPSSESWVVLSEAWSGGADWYEVCNREQFEAYVKEKEGEKWTHVFNFGFSEQAKCRIVSENGDFVWVQVDCAGCPATYKKSELKPIKPSLTKAEAWDMLKDLPANEWGVHSHVIELEDKYEII